MKLFSWIWIGYLGLNVYFIHMMYAKMHNSWFLFTIDAVYIKNVYLERIFITQPLEGRIVDVTECFLERNA